MALNIYVNYPGTCAEAFRFYERHLGGRITMLTKHGENPAGGKLAEEWKDAVLHGRIEIDGTELFAADVPGAEPMRSAYLSLTVNSAAEAERIYAVLSSEGGQVFMPMQETFFANRFAMLRDRFGASWMLLHPKPMA